MSISSKAVPSNTLYEVIDTEFGGSVFPNGTLHNLAAPKNFVGLRKVEQRGRQNKEVEDLMTSSAEVKSARCAAFRASDDIEDSTLDVDVATQAVDPASVVGDVWVKADEDQEKDSCA